MSASSSRPPSANATNMADTYPPPTTFSMDPAGAARNRRRTSSSASSPDMAALQQGSDFSAKRNKARMTARQAAMLKEVWDRNLFPTAEERAQVASQSGLSVRQVQVWFQNQRQKRRNEEYEATRPFVSDGPHPLSSVAEATSLGTFPPTLLTVAAAQPPKASSSKAPIERHRASTGNTQELVYPSKSLSAPGGVPTGGFIPRPAFHRYKSAEEKPTLPPLSWGKRPYQPEEDEEQPNKRPSVSPSAHCHRSSLASDDGGRSLIGSSGRSDTLPSLAELGLTSSSMRRIDTHHWQNMGTRLPPILDSVVAAGSGSGLLLTKAQSIPMERSRGMDGSERQKESERR